MTRDVIISLYSRGCHNHLTLCFPLFSLLHHCSLPSGPNWWPHVGWIISFAYSFVDDIMVAISYESAHLKSRLPLFYNSNLGAIPMCACLLHTPRLMMSCVVLCGCVSVYGSNVHGDDDSRVLFSARRSQVQEALDTFGYKHSHPKSSTANFRIYLTTLNGPDLEESMANQRDVTVRRFLFFC